MRLALQAALCCCALSALLPARGAAGELDRRPEERLKARLQSRVKRDIGDVGLRTASDQRLPNGQEEENATSVSPPPSCGLLIRSRRSTSKPSGCQLVTCVYHDLIFQLHQIHQIKSCAPVRKIGPGGYGRRRRRSLAPGRRSARPPDTKTATEH